MVNPKTPATGSPDDWDPLDPVNDKERRQYGRSLRDEPGLEPPNWRRPSRAFDLDTSGLSLVEDPKPENPQPAAAGSAPKKGYDPYESGGGPGRVTWNTTESKLGKPARTDLRKLSEHIKQMRTLKDRKDSDQD